MVISTRAPIEDCSGTVNEDEDADADGGEEMEVCDICGDAGYDDELAICNRCNDSAEHIYCMATMRDSVPLLWVCEGCALEEKKGSEKKRFARSGAIPTQAYKKQNISEPVSCSTMTEVESILPMQKPPLKPISFLLNGLTEKIEPTGQVVAFSSVGRDQRFSGIEAQVHEKPSMSGNLSSSLEGELAVEACLSTVRQGGEVTEAAVLSSPTPRAPSGCLKFSASGETNTKQASEIGIAREFASEGIVNTAPKKASNHARFSADGPFLGSKRVFSRSVSMKADDDQPSFLLPSRPKNLTRSKSAAVRPSVSWIGDSSTKSSYRGHGKDLPHATHEGAKHGTSYMMDHTQSTSVRQRPYRQAGQDRDMKYDKSSRELESSKLWRCGLDSGKETLNLSSRDSDSLQKGGWDGQETRRCYRCDEVGHIAAMCKNVNSSRMREWGANRAPACSEKTIVDRKSIPEIGRSSHSRNEKNSPKESSMWKSHDGDCSGTFSQPSSNTSKQTEKMYKYKRLGTRDTVNMGLKLSPKPFEKVQVLDLDGQKTSVAASSSSSISFKIGKKCSFEDNGRWQAQGVDSMREEPLQEPQPNQVILPNPQNQVILPNPQKECGGGRVVSPSEAHLPVDTSFESHCEIQAEPGVEILWSGCFNVSSNNCLTTYNGLQAHPSSKADPSVSEAIKTLPPELYVKELKRGVETDTWPSSLQKQQPTSNSIGVYFFPVDMKCHDIWYKPLLDHLTANDLALKTNSEFFQLLIFPSQLLPEAEQCWDERQYLWGVLRKSTSSKSWSTATLGGHL